MQLLRLRGKGWKSFPNQFDLDLTSITGEIVAVTGANGAGKSTLFELYGSVVPLNAKYIDTPTRGPLKGLASARDAYIEATVKLNDGIEYTIRHTVDAFNGKTATSVTAGGLDGAAVLEKGQVSEYLGWAQKHLPPASVFFATLFAAQGSKGLLGMSPGDRKAVILRVRGLERLEALASLARAHQSTVTGLLSLARARLDELGDVDVEALRGECDRLAKVLDDLAAAELSAKLRLNEAQVAAKYRDKEISNFNALVIRLSNAQTRAAKAKTQMEEIALRIKNNQTILDQREEIEAAVADVARLTSEIAGIDTRLSGLSVDGERFKGDLRSLKEKSQSLSQQRAALERAIKNAMIVIADAGKIHSAVASVSEVEDSLRAAEVERNTAFASLEEIQNAGGASKDERIVALRQGLTDVEDAIENEWRPSLVCDVATKAKDADDLAGRAEDQRPAAILSARSAWKHAEGQVFIVRSQAEALRRLAERLPEIESAEQASADATLQAVEIDEALLLNAQAQKAVDESLSELDSSITALSIQRSEVARQLITTENGAKFATQLAVGDERLKTLREQESQAIAEHAVATQEYLAIELGEEPEPLSTTEAEADHLLATREASKKAFDHQIVLNSLTAAEKNQARRLELTAEIDAGNVELADWARLAIDLGKTGLQALEVDAAGPEMTALTNDLLRSCGDTRFTIEVSTNRLSADRKKEVEGCEIMVSDSRDGSVKSGEVLSGGEAVFVNEACSLALVMMYCRQSGAKNPTIVRDEAGSALDAERGPAWVAMMRRACEIVGASHLLYVDHNPELQTLADASIRINAGEVTVQ